MPLTLDDFEKLVKAVSKMPKEEAVDKILNFSGSFKLDFSREYLEKQTVDKVRHILLAAMIQRQRDGDASIDLKKESF